RLGIDSGEVVVEGESIEGETIARAGHLSRAAAPGEGLLGEGAYRFVRHPVLAQGDRTAIDGRAEPPTRPLLAVLSGAPALPRRFDSPLVGRQAELALLREAFAEAVHDKEPRLVTVLGEAGVGKSRLAREFASLVRDDATVLVGRCVAYGEGATFWP